MKAYVLHDIGKLQYEEVIMPEPEKGSVIVKVSAAGICGSDIPRIFQTGAYFHPLIPGHEFSGVVCDTGKGEEEWQGERVGIFPLIPCGNCEQCKRKKYEMCSNYNYLGSRTNGGFAEYVKVPAWNLIKLPDKVSFEQAAMLEPMAVAMHAIRRAEISQENTIVIYGAGTIGLLVTMLLLGMGYKNINIIGNKSIQKETAKNLGLAPECFCDSRNTSVEEWILNRTKEKGADVFFDCIGKNQVIEEIIQYTAANGKVVLVGNPASDIQIEKKVYWRVLRKQLTLIGNWNSSFTHDETDDWNMVLDLFRKDRINPEKLITHKFPMNKLSDGFTLMKNKTEENIKVLGYFEN